MHLARFGRVRPAQPPAAAERMPRPSEAPGIERDDRAGPSSGRGETPEVPVAGAPRMGADRVTTRAPTRSGDALRTAASAARTGLHRHAPPEDRAGSDDPGHDGPGDGLLDALHGATAETHPGGANPAAAPGHADRAPEPVAQADAMDPRIDRTAPAPFAGGFTRQEPIPEAGIAAAAEGLRLRAPNVAGRLDELRAAILPPRLEALDGRIAGWTARHDRIAARLRGVPGLRPRGRARPRRQGGRMRTAGVRGGMGPEAAVPLVRRVVGAPGAVRAMGRSVPSAEAGARPTREARTMAEAGARRARACRTEFSSAAGTIPAPVPVLDALGLPAEAAIRPAREGREPLARPARRANNKINKETTA